MEEKDYLKAVEILFNLGASKETTIEIMYEILFNSNKYADNQENIDIMLKEKLGIDLDEKK
jgi:hypothetical protein